MENLKLLWAAPYCLHDTSSGAAIHIKAMLEKLAVRGFDIRVLSALTFDSPQGTALFPNFEEQVKTEHHFLNLEDEKVHYQYQKTASTNVMLMTNTEEREFFAQYLTTINEFKPDAVMQLGGGLLDMTVRAEAKRRGIPTMFCLCNGGYVGYKFPDVDVILNDSPATAFWYKNNSNLNLTVTGAFIYPEKIVTPTRDPKYITFINPSPEKGVSLVARLALMLKHALPKERLLVVNSRGNWYQSITALGLQGEDFSNVDITEHVTDIRPVYANTKLLLAPSLWYENFGRVAAEAILNGIPVVCSTSGGLPTAIGKGGMAVEAPKGCHENYLKVPTEEEMQPWLVAIKEVIGTKKRYETYCSQARESAKMHDIDLNADKTAEIFKTIMTGRRSSYDAHLYM